MGCGAGYSAEVCAAVFWCGWNCDNIQMMHGSEWTLKYDEPEVENVARGRSPSATFQQQQQPHQQQYGLRILKQLLLVVVVVVTFFNHNFVNCKATLILAIKIYEIKYNISVNDIHTQQ